MYLSAIFIGRFIGTTFLGTALGLTSSIVYLSASALRQVDFRSIIVSASRPGTGPETMASSVATPLEGQFARISGVAEHETRRFPDFDASLPALTPGILSARFKDFESQAVITNLLYEEHPFGLEHFPTARDKKWVRFSWPSQNGANNTLERMRPSAPMAV